MCCEYFKIQVFYEYRCVFYGRAHVKAQSFVDNSQQADFLLNIPRNQQMGMQWKCIETKDTVGGSLTVDNLLMAMYGELVWSLAANGEQ